MTILLKNFAIVGYRSFGAKPQYFDKLEKVTFLIGKNNSGKSNVLRFLVDNYPQENSPSGVMAQNRLDLHQPTMTQKLIGMGYGVTKNDSGTFSVEDSHPLVASLSNQTSWQSKKRLDFLGQVYFDKTQIDKTELAWSFVTPYRQEYHESNWPELLVKLDRNDLRELWTALTGKSGGGAEIWVREVAQKFKPIFPAIKIAFIPAIRDVGAKGSPDQGYAGSGIIDKLARFQNPTIDSQPDKNKFQAITKFVRNVLGTDNAEIEIPHDRDMIMVHMDGKTLPLSSLGSGVQEVIILAATATVLEGHLICIEEPEIHLNPLLQKKLVRYLSEGTNNQYIISTHSAALMDTRNAEIYHLQLSEGCTVVQRVTSNDERSQVCADLGYRPSDLLQANSILWVEGPSDRIYLNFWLSNLRPKWIEGLQYSIMFYGGKLSSHLSFMEDEEEVTSFIELRKLNRRGMILLDSDKASAKDKINATKQRLINEFDTKSGHSWVTAGREIENYISVDLIKQALLQVSPSKTPTSNFGKFSNVLGLKASTSNKVYASKVKIAHYIANNSVPDYEMHDLREQLDKLVKFIEDSNEFVESEV
jgi:predicted ATPase